MPVESVFWSSCAVQAGRRRPWAAQGRPAPRPGFQAVDVARRSRREGRRAGHRAGRHLAFGGGRACPETGAQCPPVTV